MPPQPSGTPRTAVISELYRAARKLPESEQRAFVESQSNDPNIQQEVLRLLIVKDMRVLNRPVQLNADTLDYGDMIADRYKVIRQIGRGGMGVVYAVLDTTMGETRALKLIRPESAARDESRSRFIREVRTAQHVTHPNVCRIFDIGIDPPPRVAVESESDRLLFYTMELLEGQTLAQRIATGPLDCGAALRIIRQIAAALKVAHDHNIIHRDLKPSNIMLVPERDDVRAVVIDFGLARSEQEEIDPRLTSSGFIVGTPAYIAPEQVLGQITPATDVYALGIVLYEMVTGTLPFGPASNPAKRTPMPPSRYIPGLDPRWEKVILKCISTDVSKRYQNSSELIAALAPADPPDLSLDTVPDLNDAATVRIERTPTVRRWHALDRRHLLGIAGVIVAAAVGSSLFLVRLSPGGGGAERYVAVLPFRVVAESANADLLAIGLTDSISARLFQWQNVRMPTTAAVERVGNLPMKRIARELGATLIVHGTIQPDGDQIQVNLTIEDVEADRVLTRQVVSGTRSRYLELQDQVYSIVVRTLDLRSRGHEAGKPISVVSTNPTATDLYWKARQQMSRQRNTEEVKQAIGLYEQCVRLDPVFARAWAYLSDAHVVLYRSSREKIDAERAVFAAEQARRLDDDLADAHFALGYAYSVIGQISTAISETRRALELAPNSAEGYRRLGRIYQDSGAKDLAINAFRHALELNPHYWNTHLQIAIAYLRYGDNANSALHYKRVTEQVPERAEGFQGLATAYLQMGDFARSEEAYKKALSLQDRPANYSGLGTAYYFQGQYADAIRMFQKAIELAPKQELYYGNLADAYRASGKMEEAREAYRKAMALAHADLSTNPRAAPSLGSLALYCAKLGDTAQSLDYIQRARSIDPGNVELQYNEAVVRAIASQTKEAITSLEQAARGGKSWKLAAADPDLRSLHSDPRFRALTAERPHSIKSLLTGQP